MRIRNGTDGETDTGISPRKGDRYLVAENSLSERIGWVHCTPDGLITSLYVKPEFRRFGVGQALLCEICDRVNAVLRIEAESPDAIAFLWEYGFQREDDSNWFALNNFMDSNRENANA